MIFIVLFFLVIFLAIVGMAIFLYKFVRKALKPKSAEFIVTEQQKMKTYVTEKQADLVTWNNDSYLNVTGNMKYQFTRKMSRELKGVLLDKENKKLAAFWRLERGMGADGYTYIATSNAIIKYEHTKHNKITIYWNDALLGTIHESGKITNYNNQEIGFAKHPPIGQVSIPFYTHKFGANTFILKLNNRDLATIFVAPDLSSQSSSSISLSNENLGDKIIELLDTPTGLEEEKWLSAIALFETAFYGHFLI